MITKLFSRKQKRANTKAPRNDRPTAKEPAASPRPTPEYRPAVRESLDSDELRRLHQQGRSNIILREEAKWRSQSGGPAILERVKNELEQRMALVPAGSVSLPQTLSAQAGGAEQEIEVEPFLLCIHPVTCAEFQRFADAGGYDELDYWPEEIWPHLIELKDQTGHPGPRFWRQGRHDVRYSDHPVVGVSWYEAQAYALWIGQRLPTEADWQMAASWHINSSADLMRRFPWGDAMDSTRCNIWNSRHKTTVSVQEYASGAAPNHVLQLIGNVWEWMDSEYTVVDDRGNPIIGEMPMHAVRGGAFDTYFETQASSHFRTGLITLSRMHNTGFRTAMDLSEAGWINGE